jgi:sterol desaturase/sphingolipid hydroxylase (fatty acid hydroxylase superfamily)
MGGIMKLMIDLMAGYLTTILHFIFGQNIEWKQVVLTIMTPLFLLAFAVEWLAVRGDKKLQRQFNNAEILTNMSLGGSYQVLDVALHILVIGSIVHWFYLHRIADIPVNPWTVTPIFFAMEFAYYCFHRASHRIRWFWSAHVVHHSSETMNLTTAMRQGMLYGVTGWWLFFIPLIVLGVAPGVVFFMYGLDLAYQYFVHTETIQKLPHWVEFFFVTPSHHRAHHGRNPKYIDKNFGGVFIIFDRLLGTFVEEEETVDYGIVRQIHSHNILVINFHEFIAMWRDVCKPGKLSERFKHLWGPPEWERTTPQNP